MQSQNIYEFIVLQHKDHDVSVPALMADYDREARSITGFVASRHFKSFYALPKPDSAPVYVMIYQWADRNTIPAARDYLVNTSVLKSLFATVDITGFALTEQIEGHPLDVQSLALEPGLVLEVAIRRIKAGQEQAFATQRKTFLTKLESNPGVLSSAEFKAVMGNNPERLSVGISTYRDQIAFHQVAATLFSDPATAAYFATFDPEAVKYLEVL